MRDLLARVQLGAVLGPLPDLRARDFRGGGVFHQIVNGNAAVAVEPRGQVLQADVDVPLQTFLGDGSAWE